MPTTVPTSPAAKRRYFKALHDKARAAGLAAAEAAVPTPMVVTQHASPLVDSSPVTQAWYVSEGVCGFGWVNIRPGTSAFARWAKENLGARKSYYGGVNIWVGEFGQSYERKVAYARAYAAVLSEAGITAYGSGRLD